MEIEKEILNKPFLTNADIIGLLNCSPSKASRIKKLIQNELTARGKKLITNEVPTRLFIEIMNLDVNFE